MAALAGGLRSIDWVTKAQLPSRDSTIHDLEWEKDAEREDLVYDFAVKYFRALGNCPFNGAATYCIGHEDLHQP